MNIFLRLLNYFSVKGIVSKLIAIDKKFILILFMIGTFAELGTTVYSNYDEYYKIQKRITVSKKLVNIEKVNTEKLLAKKNKLLKEISSLQKSVISHEDITIEKAQFQNTLESINKNSNGFVKLEYLSFKNAPLLNYYEGKVKFHSLNHVMTLMVISILEENGYLIKDLSKKEATIIKIQKVYNENK